MSEAKTDYPCHSLERMHWCDRDGPGGFMGHTCVPTPAGPLCITPETAKLAMEIHWRRSSPQVGEVGSEDDIRFLALAMAGEAGEAANVVKKAWRDGLKTSRPKLAEEIAGTASYLIGLAHAIGMDLDVEIRRQMGAFERRYPPPTNDDDGDPTCHGLLRPRGNGGVVNAEICFNALLLVGDVDLALTKAMVSRWTPDAHAQAYDWAIRLHLKASDNDDVYVPPRPEFIPRRAGR